MKNARALTRNITLFVSLGAVVLGCSRAEDSVTIPSDTPLVVSLATTTRSDWVESGQTLRGRLETAVLVDGKPALEAGLPVTLEVVQSHGARGDVPARMELRIVAIERTDGRTAVGTRPLEIVGKSEGMSDTEKIAAGTVGGAIVGGIAEGGKGAAIGGILGAAAGSAVAVATRDDAIVLAAGQKLRFETSDPFEIPRS
jgi:hypothetical protein